MTGPTINPDLSPHALATLLRQPGRSQAELARRLNLDPSAVNRILKGQRQIKARELPTITAYLEETAPGRFYLLGPGVEENVTTRAAAELLRAGGTLDLRTLVAQSYVHLLTHLQLALDRRLRYLDPKAELGADYWAVVRRSLDGVIFMGLGAGILNPRFEQVLRDLDRLYDLAHEHPDVPLEDAGAPGEVDACLARLTNNSPPGARVWALSTLSATMLVALLENAAALERNPGSSAGQGAQ